MYEPSPPLEIPDAALQPLFDLRPDYEDDEEARADAVDIAVPIVAAELRRLADELDVVREEMRATDDRTIRSSGLGEGIRRIRARADELEGAAS